VGGGGGGRSVLCCPGDTNSYVRGGSWAFSQGARCIPELGGPERPSGDF
jgi:hypothetical protein